MIFYLSSFALGFNSAEILTAVRTLSTLEHIDVYERLIWFMIEIALTFNTSKVYGDSTTLQPAKDAVVAALDQFAPIEAGNTTPIATSKRCI